jgi:two-component system chemotaxis sensor kinase CheA
VTKLVRYLVLPKELSSFERAYLARMNRVALVFFLVHVPLMTALAYVNKTGAGLGFALSAAVVAGPALAYATLSNPRTVSMVHGIAAMFMGGVLVHVGQGPVQIEMHFYFFALLAMLAVFGNPMVIVAAAVTVALHHLVLWFFLPESVFNYQAPLWVVAVHAIFVVLESAAGCFIARSFFDNVIGLEKIVRDRTAELDVRNRDMRLVLDHVGQGLLTLDRRGVPSTERSSAFDRWFPSTQAGETAFDLFGQASPSFAERSRAGWEEVVSGVMPLALTLEQMPGRLVAGDRQLKVAYVPIGEDGSPARFLLVVTDETAEVSRVLAEQEGKETVELFERLLADAPAVEAFFEEAAALTDAIAGETTKDLPTVRRMLHTLKGNSAIFGLLGLSSACHDLESWIAEENKLPPADVVAPLRAHWDGLVTRVERLRGAKRNVIEVEESEHGALEESVRQGTAGEALLARIHALKLEATEHRLHHFAEQARRVAARLDKEIDVRVDSSNLRLDPKHWRGFWSAFIHVVRNAVDHGLETEEERVAHGKSPRGTITLRTCVTGDRFVVEVVDDGRGIDWTKVARRAAELGLPAGSETEWRDALFQDGVSTATRVTDISGRGLGMGAMRHAIEELGGRIEIESHLQKGTTLRMVFAKTSMAPNLRPLPRTTPSAAA